MVTTAEQTSEGEIIDLITQTDHPVVAGGLIDLHTRHAQVEHTRATVLQLTGEVVLERHIDAEQRRERLVDTHRRHVEHTARHGIARCGVVDEAQPIHVLVPSAIAGVGAHCIGALIGMAEVDTLEVFAEPRQLAQAAVLDGPVGQHTLERGEDGEPLATHIGVGSEEGGNHHVGTVFVTSYPPAPSTGGK